MKAKQINHLKSLVNDIKQDMKSFRKELEMLKEIASCMNCGYSNIQGKVGRLETIVESIKANKEESEAGEL